MTMDTALGLLELVGYIAGILALSAVITVAVVKISPSQSAKERSDRPE
jgi:hypothetical protein